MKKILLLSVCMISLCWNVPVHAQGITSDYAIVKRISLPGDGGWDYLTADEVAGRLYVSHGTMVLVVDTKTGTLAGTIDNTPGVHGIAVARDLNRGYISNGRDNSVTVFNLQTLEVISTVKVTGQNPDAILYDPFSRKVFAFNGRSANATVLDANSLEVLATITLDGKPEFSVADGKGMIYVNIEDKSLVTQINATTLQVEQRWPLAPGEEPSGLALDNKTHRLFSVCANKLMVVMDATTGKVITTLPIGEGCDGVKFDPGTKRVFSSNGEGTMTVVQENRGDNFIVMGNVVTQAGARTISVDTHTHHLFLPTAEFLPPAEPTADNPRPRRSIKPGSFVVLEIAPVK
jgi:YVTN family beta-propeller protein